MKNRAQILTLYMTCVMCLLWILRFVAQSWTLKNVEARTSFTKTNLRNLKSSSLEALELNQTRKMNILFWNSYFHYSSFGMGLYNEGFIARKCRFTNCYTSNMKSKWKKGNMDAIVFHGLVDTIDVKEVAMLKAARASGKIRSLFVLYILESPLEKRPFSDPVFMDFFDILYSYRRDSEVYFPYGKVVPMDDSQEKKPISSVLDKKKHIAWFVSHCSTGSGREDYVRKLRTHLKSLKVDIFGACGNMSLPGNPNTNDVSAIEKRRLSMFKEVLKDYKFYLAFENAKCKDYITEKFFYSLSVPNVIPVVLGANRSEYEAVAPSKSFIHVNDFKSPKDLANYLEKLSKDPKEFSSYQLWRNHFSVEVPYDSAPCDFCRVLNERASMTVKPKPIHDINEHWTKQKCFS